jgi:hypothetical protein
MSGKIPANEPFKSLARAAIYNSVRAICSPIDWIACIIISWIENMPCPIIPAAGLVTPQPNP